ncbi:MAG: ATP-binding protein [Micropruina sp.]|uniref:AAA family ATPase n=1 Tax=Micropruina sp. TaxID=2737536 RepID=UPI0039E57362
MMLLRFSAENHKSLRDRAELDLVSSRLKTQRPDDGDWQGVIYPVAGIFGANASGKSTVLNALHYAQTAVRHSASTWLARRSVPRTPFRLDSSRDAPSSFTFDMVVDGVRHEYGFTLNASGVLREWLIDYPTGRRRLIFQRDTSGSAVFEFGRAFARPAAIAASTAPRELMLSRGAQLEHDQLTRVWKAIVDGIEFATFSDLDRSRRIASLIDAVREGHTRFDEIVTLLRIADIGIESVSIEEEQAPEALRAVIQALNSSLAPADGDIADGIEPITVDEVFHRLNFIHRGQFDTTRGLGIEEESTGTISWLSLAVPAVNALRAGSLLCIDEIDASLHTQLSTLLIEMFQDRSLNTRGAQLVFTSHDTLLLAPQTSLSLNPEQIWFTEKGADGVTELFSVADFPGRSSDNVAKRYLAGRYGAIPRLAPSLLSNLLTDSRQL